MMYEGRLIYKLFTILMMVFVLAGLFFGLIQIRTVGIPIVWDFVEAPYFIWTYRFIDVIAQGFIIFATVAAIAALLREEKVGFEEEEEGEEEA